MKKVSIKSNNYPVLFAVVFSALYFVLHYGYLQIPTADYMGNFLPAVRSIIHFDFDNYSNKILPLYPSILALLSSLNPFREGDYIYHTALLCNFLLLIPYFYMIYKIYRQFLDNDAALFALLFLAVNPYTTVTYVNAELEMFMAASSVAAFYFMNKNDTLSALFCSLTSLTKLDGIFILPAWLAGKIKTNGIRLRALMIAGFSGLPLFLWMLYMFLRNSSNTYVGEIARRGPNVYRFFIDAFFVLSGFVQWSAMHIYRIRQIPGAIPVALFAVIWSVLIIFAVVTGIRRLIREHHPLTVPLFIYTGGYFIVHCVYQNSKDRYVFAVLWILTLFAAVGFQYSIIPFLRSLSRKQSVLICVISTFIGISYIPLVAHTYPRTVISIFLFFAAFVVLYYNHSKSDNKKTAISVQQAAVLSFSLTLIITASFHGTQLFDHYSLRRMQFKIAAEWMRENLTASDRVLVTESTVSSYFGAFEKAKPVHSSKLKSDSVDELLIELKKKKVTHIFIDDFYIQRLLLNDKNATERNAALMRQLRDQAPHIDSLVLEKEIRYNNDTGYIYSVKSANETQ